MMSQKRTLLMLAMTVVGLVAFINSVEVLIILVDSDASWWGTQSIWSWIIATAALFIAFALVLPVTQTIINLVTPSVVQLLTRLNRSAKNPAQTALRIWDWIFIILKVGLTVWAVIAIIPWAENLTGNDFFSTYFAWLSMFCLLYSRLGDVKPLSTVSTH